jgi:GT2 family glycosyltransferase
MESTQPFETSDLAVIIPTRSRWNILRRTLSALQNQTVQGFEVLVVVDGIDQRPPNLGVQTILKKHGGPGAARNLGARSTAKPLLLFLGDDMIPTPRLVQLHLERHRANPEPNVAVLGHVDWHPEVPQDRLHRWLDWSGTQFDFAAIQGEEAGWGRFYSCNVSIKRDFFLGAGGFDEEFTFDYEDLDFGYRLNEKGLRLLYEPTAIVQHLHPYDWNRALERWKSRAGAERLMMAKHPWFTPYFGERIRAAEAAPRVSRIWPLIAELIPANAPRVRDKVRARAERWYQQQLAPAYLGAWEGDRDLEELQAYLGNDYDHAKLVDHQGTVDKEHEAVGDEAVFYRTSEGYLYDLTAFSMSGTKDPYLRVIQKLVPRGSRLLDYGCGIGGDGLRLIESGYRVDFADFENPSTRYLQWRLKRRGHSARVFDLDREEVPGGYDAVFCFDVIEHIDDPLGFLTILEEKAPIVVVNFLEPSADDTHLHKPLPIRRLVAHATQKGLLHYRVYHGRSHLVAYRTSEANVVIRLGSKMRLWATRLR